MKPTLRWALLFAIIFVVSIDLWWWGSSAALGPLGLPWWIYYFVALQFVLAIAVYGFAVRHWPSDDEDT